MITLRIAGVSAQTGLAEQTIRNWVSMGRFPKPFKLSSVAVWDEADIDNYLLTKKQESYNGSNRRAGETESV